MKNKFLLTCLIAFCLTFYVNSQSAKGLSLNGTTGLISTPTAHIGWEKSADIGIDVGYHNVSEDGADEAADIAKVNVSLFKRFEIGLAYDSGTVDDEEDILFTGKLQFFNEGNTAAAIGGDYQQIKISEDDDTIIVKHLYLVSTFSGTFMDLPAITTICVGKYFGDDISEDDEDNINYSMGFQLGLFPSLFKNHVFWMNDFANYSYSYDPTGANSLVRGVFNTGIRIDPIKNNKYKFVIDLIMTDALDANRAITLGGTIGLAAK